nr:hypothetical protein CFP56_70415 [Quercus suber]
MLRSYHIPSQGSRKRSHSDDYSYEYQGVQHMSSHPGASGPLTIEVAPAVQSAQLQPTPYMYQVPSQRRSPPAAHSPYHHSLTSSHHHHRLPHQPGPMKMQRTGYGPDSDQDDDNGPPSVVGQPGMPMPASRPKGPKLKFTSDDDQLLVNLKENKNLTWKQIADFFPGRSSGTLQVRYCTKLKAKTTIWTDEMVRTLSPPISFYVVTARTDVHAQLQRLRIAIEEYNNERWRIISGKVGNGFTPSACKDKSAELSGEDVSDVETVNRDDAPLSATDSALDAPYNMGPFPRDNYDREVLAFFVHLFILVIELNEVEVSLSQPPGSASTSPAHFLLPRVTIVCFPSLRIATRHGVSTLSRSLYPASRQNVEWSSESCGAMDLISTTCQPQPWLISGSKVSRILSSHVLATAKTQRCSVMTNSAQAGGQLHINASKSKVGLDPVMEVACSCAQFAMGNHDDEYSPLPRSDRSPHQAQTPPFCLTPSLICLLKHTAVYPS